MRSALSDDQYFGSCVMDVLKVLQDCFLRLAGPSWTLITEPDSPEKSASFSDSLRSLHAQTGESSASAAVVTPEAAPPATTESPR